MAAAPLKASRPPGSISMWMAMVKASHGNNDAFSTGSHAQNPPQPSSA